MNPNTETSKISVTFVTRKGSVRLVIPATDNDKYNLYVPTSVDEGDTRGKFTVLAKATLDPPVAKLIDGTFMKFSRLNQNTIEGLRHAMLRNEINISPEVQEYQVHSPTDVAGSEFKLTYHLIIDNMPLQISRRCVVHCDVDDPYHRMVANRRIEEFTIRSEEQDRASTRDWISAVLGTGAVEQDGVADVLAIAKNVFGSHPEKGKMAFLVADVLHELCPSDFDWQSLRKLEETDTCKVCLDAISEVFTFPCHHLLMCRSCSDRTSRCPLCRCVIQMKLMECQIPDGIRVYRA